MGRRHFLKIDVPLLDVGAPTMSVRRSLPSGRYRGRVANLFKARNQFLKNKNHFGTILKPFKTEEQDLNFFFLTT